MALKAIVALQILLLGLASAIEFPVMDSAELIEFWGYEVENHWIETQDGYIIHLHRIPKHNSSKTIFVQHGLFASSQSFLTGPPDRSFAYMLSDMGYDVWLANSRGNTYSRNHTTLDPDMNKRKFWNFEWDIAAMGDLPAAIEFIKRLTGKEKLFYAGHSMGSTEFLVAASELPEFQDNFHAAFLMAPAAFMGGHTDDILANLSAHWKELETAFELFGIWEFLPNMNITSDIGHNLCDEDHFEENEDTCLAYADIIVRVSPGQLNVTMLPIYFDSFPEGSSVKSLVHYGQSIDNKYYFRKYDQGTPEANLALYGTPEPPDYNLGNITLPVYLFYGNGDTLAIAEDVLHLADELSNVEMLYQVPLDGWTHSDFAYAIDAADLVYSVIINEMELICGQINC